MNEVVLVEDVKTEQGLPQERVHAANLEPLAALQLLLQGSLTELCLDVQTLVLDPRLSTDDGNINPATKSATPPTRQTLRRIEHPPTHRKRGNSRFS